jgi:UDP-2,3-diacylglucosamine pyrophosphatase LpxH
MSHSFERANFTAIVSDMHLCEAEPVHPRFPLWKKYKTKQFFFDDVFNDFLHHIETLADGHPVELVLNGDIFDFDSVMSQPDEPSFRISNLEKQRGLYPRPERSKYKIQVILKHHELLVQGLQSFLNRGNRVVFVIGNHDLELHFPEVQEEILASLAPQPDLRAQIRFCEWFYVSNKDTLIEHGNQYDAYCSCDDPINPFFQGYNFKGMRLPFGNLACRYILNGMGFFNPHVESNFIMSLSEYVRFFTKYMLRAQPTLMLDWFYGAMVTLWKSFSERFYSPIRDPLKIEDKVNQIALKANATPRMVRELKELFVDSASNNPFLIMRELWLDRAFIVLIAFVLIFQLMLLIKQFFHVSFFWAFIPLFILLPFFVFYSKSVTSLVSGFKEPDERILATAAAITGVQRIVYGHTHLIRHEMIGAVEHLNSGCWSPAFLDVECTQAMDQKTFVWLTPTAEGPRTATLKIFAQGGSKKVQNFMPRKKK